MSETKILLSDLLKDAVDKAIITSKKAVSTYYKYNVCAVLIDESGNEFVGVNWETANGDGNCGESSAISRYLLSERKKIEYVITFGCPAERDPNGENFCTTKADPRTCNYGSRWRYWFVYFTAWYEIYHQ